MNRPFLAHKIAELEHEYVARNGDREFLSALIDELAHRNSARAAALKTAAEGALRALRPEAPATRRLPAVPPPPNPLAAPGSTQAVLHAWTALEVLSPQSYRRPEDLSSDRQAIARLDQGRLPWEGGGEKSHKNFRLYYQVVLGSIRLDETIQRILDRYVDRRVERPAAKGKAILAVIMVDRHGIPVEPPAATVSSFGWAVPHALGDRLGALGGWAAAEATLVKALDDRLRRRDADGRELPLDRAGLTAAYDWLLQALDLPPELAEPPSFAVRAYQYFKNPEPPEPLLLNSFFLGDLAKARAAFDAGTATANLRRYLCLDRPLERHDLLHDTAALEQAVAPVRTPPARWPGRGRHPLALLQQAAVNLALSTLKDGGILAVNGPPGTGKTTLLRDLVAGLVCERAEAMAVFEDAHAAFVHSGEKIKAGQGWLHLYRLDARLKGFEIVVASSNNKAVENVSAELPGVEALAEDAGLRYFRCLSDALHQPRETWGLIAAVLGNAANRARFRQTFWWDEEVGMSTFLAECAGAPQLISDPAGGPPRPPRIVLEEEPPSGHAEALAVWHAARNAFRKASAASRRRLREIEEIRQSVLKLPAAADRRERAERALDDRRPSVSRHQHDPDPAALHVGARNHPRP